MSLIGIGKNQQIFVALETNVAESAALIGDPATARIKYPTLLADNNNQFMLLTAGEGQINQELELLDDKQLRNGRSKREKITGRYNPGKFTFPVYIKTGGLNVGLNVQAPEMNTLLKSAFGAVTAFDVIPATGATYTLKNANLPFTMFVKKDHTLFCGVGATVNTAKFSVKGNDIGMVTFDGEFMGMFKAGTSTIKLIASGVTSAVVELVNAGDASLFDVGMPINVYSSALGDSVNASTINTPAGYRITSIDTVTGIMGISPSITTVALTSEVPLGTHIFGYIPNSSGVTHTERGTPIHGKRGILTLDPGTGPVNITVLEATLDLNNNVKYSVDEKNGTFYAKDFFNSEFRDVTGTMKIYFRPGDVKYWNDAFNRSAYALSLPCGDVDGHKFVIKCPKIQLDSPTIAGENEITMDLKFNASLSAAIDDELSIEIH